MMLNSPIASQLCDGYAECRSQSASNRQACLAQADKKTLQARRFPRGEAFRPIGSPARDVIVRRTGRLGAGAGAQLRDCSVRFDGAFELGITGGDPAEEPWVQA